MSPQDPVLVAHSSDQLALIMHLPLPCHFLWFLIPVPGITSQISYLPPSLFFSGSAFGKDPGKDSVSKL